eukprot:11166507-Lingulodinium_polyedra.AAC.1
MRGQSPWPKREFVFIIFDRARARLSFGARRSNLGWQFSSSLIGRGRASVVRRAQASTTGNSVARPQWHC